MALRKALSYSKKRARPYTRKSKSKSKNYIKVNPNNKIVKFTLGEHEAYKQGKFKLILKLIADEGIQIRDNALESGRIQLNKHLDKHLPKAYYMAVKVYPHHILRNNKTAAGAGADRLSSGMKHSFGVVEGRAAFVNPGQAIFLVACENERGARFAREGMRMIKAKMPCRTKILFEKIA